MKPATESQKVKQTIEEALRWFPSNGIIFGWELVRVYCPYYWVDGNWFLSIVVVDNENNHITLYKNYVTVSYSKPLLALHKLLNSVMTSLFIDGFSNRVQQIQAEIEHIQTSKALDANTKQQQIDKFIKRFKASEIRNFKKQGLIIYDKT